MKAQLPKRTFSEQDAELFRNAKSGGNEAVMQLFMRHAHRFRKTIGRILAARLRNILDPEDLLQETAIILLTKQFPAWISTPADFARYVGGIAKNIALAQNRKHLDGRHHSLYREVPVEAVLENDSPQSPQPSPDDVAEYKETLADLHEWLPLRISEIVTWVLAGYSVAEVAALLDIEEKTVVMFVCAANNFRPHPECKISQDDALHLFKRRSRRKKYSLMTPGSEE